MDTAAISYRVVDFLKEHPPFNDMDVADLLTFAQLGRVKFFEAHQFIMTQGATRFDVLVIQQGTVLLWDERGAEARLIDVRGPGAMLGIEGFNQARSYPYSARSANDVLIYSFPANEFDALVEKYPEAREYVSAYDRSGGDYRSRDQNDPQSVSVRSLIGAKHFASCSSDASIREAGRRMLDAKADVLVLLDAEQRARGLLTGDCFIEWAAKGGGSGEQPALTLCEMPVTVTGDASVAAGALAMAAANTPAVTITTDGTLDGQVLGVVKADELGSAFGDRPQEILRIIRGASSLDQLRDASQRSRILVRRYLSSASSSDWLSAFTSLVDGTILKRLLVLTEADDASLCWCFCGPSGRTESLTAIAPGIVVLASDNSDEARYRDALKRVHEAIGECGYLPAADDGFDVYFHAAAMSDWKHRYSEWIDDPILKKIYTGRPFFDLRPIAGNESLCRELEVHVFNAVSREFLFIAANDCLGTLPPLTFFQNAVVEGSGQEKSVFRLEETALNPLVDVARVFGIATGKVFGSSTLDRFAKASRVHPEDAAIFEEASATFRTVLWQQGRVGLAERSSGAELPPALLSPYDRQVLRSGFQSISRLLEWFENLEWVKSA